MEISDFSASLILREINFQGFEKLKMCHFFAVLEPNDFEFGRFQPFRIDEFSFTQYSKPLKMEKGQFSNFWEHQN